MFIRSLLGAALLALSSVSMADTVAPSQVSNLGNNFNLAPFGDLTVNWSDGTPNVGLIQFDLSAYTGQTVSSATLSLFQQANSDNTAVFGLFANTAAWTPSNGIVGSGPSFLATPVAQITISDWNSQVWRSADLTAIVNDWTHGVLPNYGLTFERLDQANPFLYFGSGAAGTNGPTLSLTTAAVPEPENIALLLAGIACLGAVARRRGMRA